MAVGGQTSNPSAYALTVGGIDYTLWIDATSISWSESGTEIPSRFECTLASKERSDKTVTAGFDFTGKTLRLQDLTNARVLWAGYVDDHQQEHGVGPVVYHRLQAVSWDALLDRQTIPKWRSTTDGTARARLILSDRAMVQKVIAAFGYGITANNTYVQNTNADMPRITLTSVTTRDLLSAIADAAAWPASPLARRFYVDFDQRLHYYKDTEGTSAPYKIGDALYTGDYIIPDWITYGKNVTDAAKKVYIKGANKHGTGEVSNTSTTVRPFDRVDMIDVPESDSTRAKIDIATAYFNREGSAVVGGRFTVTGYDGWRAGQTLTIRDDAFGVNTTFQIRELQAVPNMGSGKTTYEISYGALPYRLSMMTNRKSRAAAGAGGRANPGAAAGAGDGAASDDSRAQEGGGGGCFVAGTLVATPNGERAIESLSVGDSVYTVNDTLEALVGRVTATLPHPANTEPRLLLALGSGRKIETTIGHRFYDPILGDFKTAALLKVGEYVTDFGSGEAQITRILSITPVGDDPLNVYNLTVEPHHTYLVAGILVHNAKTP